MKPNVSKEEHVELSHVEMNQKKIDLDTTDAETQYDVESAVESSDDENEVDPAEITNKEGNNTALKSSRHPPSLFTDNKGNLKFVNLVVRNPCIVFFYSFLLQFFYAFC
mmetsp:Transcript_12602/g.15332  ORF Transcript_12602/g.15332 Transcript_12602/m.15332 type:complete len:109 (-) Transcript_12602:3151-3477(-)